MTSTVVFKGVEKWLGRLLCALFCVPNALGQTMPIQSCDAQGIGSIKLIADARATITSVGIEKTPSEVSYCLVKVQVQQAINIWIGLPMNGRWNGRLQSEGGGGYAGVVGVPMYSILGGYVGVQTDTGHTLKDGISGDAGGAFGLRPSGVANTPLQKDFGSRSQHLMAVMGKQLTQAFYGRQPRYSYWNGCSEGGREGLRMAQDFPNDYDGVLAGAPAINWDRAGAYELWPQVVMKELLSTHLSIPKLTLATRAAITACDALDQVTDGVIADPRRCKYSAVADRHLTQAACDAFIDTCLTPKEAAAIDLMWKGPANAKGQQLWPGLERGAALDVLAGPNPSPFAMDQARYWVYLNPAWDWHRLSFANFETFFSRSVEAVHPILATDNTDLSAFQRHRGKLIIWHGWSDPLLMPEGSIQYYDSVASGPGYNKTQQFFRLFMAPGVGHCASREAPQPGSLTASKPWLAAQERVFEALVEWVERGHAPERIIASQSLASGQARTRPLCPYPSSATYIGHGSTDDAVSFACTTQ